MQKSPRTPTVQVQVLYAEGCPHAAATIELVRRVSEDTGIAIALHPTLVETEEQAIRSRFAGSPTVLVDGLDIVPAARHQASYGLG